MSLLWTYLATPSCAWGRGETARGMEGGMKTGNVHGCLSAAAL